MKSITATAPATIANLGPGFDCLGMAITGLADRVRVERISGNRIEIKGMTGRWHSIPADPHQNTAAVAVRALLRASGRNIGISLEIEKGIPPGSGLGSSAASAAAAVVAVNQLLNLHKTPRELITFAMEGERVAAGVAHADNVAPAILGNITLVRSSNPLDVAMLRPPKGLSIVAVHPDEVLGTRESRRVLPRHVPFADAVQQWSNVAGLVAGLCNRDLNLIGRSMQDGIVEPARRRLIPHYDTIKRIAEGAGALGVTIAGGGPSMFALVSGKIKAARLAKGFEEGLAEASPSCEIFVATISSRGARVL